MRATLSTQGPPRATGELYLLAYDIDAYSTIYLFKAFKALRGLGGVVGMMLPLALTVAVRVP